MIYRRMLDGRVEEQTVNQGEAVFANHYDVIVAGLGTAGAYAGISAGMMGASVLGVDRLSCAGGMGTGGYVSGYYYGLGGGLHEEVDRTADRFKEESFADTVEPKKYLFEQKLIENHVEMRMESVVTGVFLEGKEIKGVSIFSQGIQQNVSCYVLIDATADAVVCVMAGCKTVEGRELDGKMRPFTSVKVSVRSNGDLVRTNHDSGYIDPYDPFSLSKGILEAHSSQMLDEFTNRQERVLFVAPFIGIREGRLIEAEKMIHMLDIIDEKQEEEPLFYGYSDFDKHGKDHALETEDLQDWYVAANLSTVCLSVPVTIAHMAPKGYKGLLVAGRQVGMDHDTASLLRMKRDMQKCGESAGVVAALAAQKRVHPIEVPYDEIKKILEATGCLTEAHNKGIWFDDSFRREKIQWMQDPEEIKTALATDMPGVAIYSCKRMGEAIVPYLKKWLQESKGHLRYNSGIALGLVGDKESFSLLREIVEQRDCFYYQDCRRTNQLRTAIAIYLLGKQGDEESIWLFQEILCNTEEYEKELYHQIQETSYKFNTNESFNEVYYQIISQAAVAVTKIVKKHPKLQEKGTEILKKAFADDRHITNTTSMPEGTFEYESMNNIREYVLHTVS